MPESLVSSPEGITRGVADLMLGNGIVLPPGAGTPAGAQIAACPAPRQNAGAYFAASRIASIMLTADALPVPAMSNAVP